MEARFRHWIHFYLIKKKVIVTFYLIIVWYKIAILTFFSCNSDYKGRIYENISVYISPKLDFNSQLWVYIT